jgi:hypothetical protein
VSLSLRASLGPSGQTTGRFHALHSVRMRSIARFPGRRVGGHPVYGWSAAFCRDHFGTGFNARDREPDIAPAPSAGALRRGVAQRCEIGRESDGRGGTGPNSGTEFDAGE